MCQGNFRSQTDGTGLPDVRAPLRVAVVEVVAGEAEPLARAERAAHHRLRGAAQVAHDPRGELRSRRRRRRPFLPRGGRGVAVLGRSRDDLLVVGVPSLERGLTRLEEHLLF